MFEFHCRDMNLDDDCIIRGTSKLEVMDDVVHHLWAKHQIKLNEFEYDNVIDLIQGPSSESSSGD